ncbi:MAG TPA: ABC transporter permease, partial [Mucilaginibacter sp.]|jgi:predicted permease|nr:ABC transporter permease [Mucilaginibacter sp.]
MLLEFGVLALEVRESIRTGTATYDTLTFHQMSPVLHLVAFISVATYLYWSFRLIERFYQRLKFNNVSDRYRCELRWLHRLLAGFGLLWLLWIPYAVVDCFYYHYPLGLHACYPLYLLLAVMMIWIAAVAFLRPEVGVPGREPLISKPSPSGELRQKGIWLKNAVETNLFYLDSELSIPSLAEALDMHPYELSRIINAALRKNFNDFINEYRIREVTRKMKDPVYDRLTLLGIAFDCGFNSKTTFNRTFKQMTGKSPVEYKNDLKKERPFYHLEPHSHSTSVISFREATPRCSSEKLNRDYMFRNYLKTTLRSLLKNRSYSFLNIAGLAIGVTCASLIFLWAQDELTYNRNFEKRDYLYKVYENNTYEGKVGTFIVTPGPLAKAMKVAIPGIKNVARMTADGDRALFALGEKAITEKGNYADSEIFSMLKLPFVSGSGAVAFQQLQSIVISEKMAKKFFGDADPMGKSLRINNEQDYTVTGVFKDLPENSTYQFQWLAPMQNVDHKQPWRTMWSSNWCHTLVELDPAARVVSVNQQLKHFISAESKIDNPPDCFLYSMNDWNLHDNFANGRMEGGKIQYVKMFSFIAWLVLLIACINFMNLSTARSEQRAKEVGVRKVMGAGKGQLIGQFIGEAVIMSFISVLVAVGLIYMAMPYFNNLVQKQLAPNIFEPSHLLYLVMISLVTGLLAGSYPAFYLSSFNPIAVLKNSKIKSSSGSGFIRQSLVVIQFSVSIILIIGTVTIYQQIQHIKNRELGYDKNNLVYINLQGNEADHFTAVYNDLQRSGIVGNATTSSDPVLGVVSSSDSYSWDGMDATKHPLVSKEDVSAQFVSTMGMKLAAGRGFNTNSSLDSTHVMINEALAKEMGKEGRIGGIIRDDDKKAFTITGILKDYLYNDLYGAAAPLLLYNRPTPAGTGVLTMRFKPGVNLQDALVKAGAIVKADNPGYPFEYFFIDDDFNQLFKTETLTGTLAGVFASLAIFISCLGLFGLAAYTAEQRIKEIGIRKVLGASVSGLAGLLSKDFLKLVGISCLIAFPVAFWAINNWLQSYQYRVSIHWWVFAIAATMAILIALATVSFQAVKAALMNPVKSLRSE